MAYTKQVWRDLETGGTPITAERLNHIEDGIEENSNNWDSISPTELTTLVNIDGKHKVTYEVRSGIVIVRGNSLGDSSTGGTNVGGSKNVDIGTMPEGLRPSEETFFYLSGRGGSTGNQANKIMPNGTIRLYNTSSSINWWSFTCSYPIA